MNKLVKIGGVFLLIVLGITIYGLIKVSKMERVYKLRAGATSPEGYPVMVTSGGFDYGILNGLIIGPWGDVSYLWGRSERPLPRRLAVEWVSFAEGECGKAYQIKTDIDYNKIEQLFKTPYTLEYAGKISEERYKTIVAGFAPGGVVMVWVQGDARMIEIGRYQGYEVTPKDSDLYPETLKMLTPFFNKMHVNSDRVIPAEVREANKGKEPPYGMWDKFRERFNYTIKLNFPDNVEHVKGTCTYVNGEFKYLEKYVNGGIEFTNEAAPRDFLLIWRTENGVEMRTEVYLDDATISELFRQLNTEYADEKIVLTIRFNIPYDYGAVTIGTNSTNEVFVPLKKQPEIKSKQY